MALRDIIQSIIDEANGTTGASDDNVTGAVQSLIDGYGGGSGGGLSYAEGTWTPTSGGNPALTVTHNLNSNHVIGFLYLNEDVQFESYNGYFFLSCVAYKSDIGITIKDSNGNEIVQPDVRCSSVITTYPAPHSTLTFGNQTTSITDNNKLKFEKGSNTWLVGHEYKWFVIDIGGVL